jgi:hypothetical protein
MDPKMIPFPKSSTVHSAGYDPKTQQLHVQYKGGTFKYVFDGVPESVYQGLLNAPSKGQFNANHIKPNFKKFSKVRPIPPQL